MSTAQDEADDGPSEIEEQVWRNDTDGEGEIGINDGVVEEQGAKENERDGDSYAARTNGAKSSILEDIDDSRHDETSKARNFSELERPSSADGSLSIPDDTPSLQSSAISTPRRRGRLGSYSRSPTPSLKPFDRRFQARNVTPLSASPRPSSPAFLQVHSRQSSTSYIVPEASDTEVEAPWDVVRWTKLRKMTGQAFSENGKRQFGRPTCIAVSASIALGTSKGLILVFDYNQNLKAIIGQGTKATESDSVTSISISADHAVVAGGHASGNIFTWELSKPARPFLHIAPTDRSLKSTVDGHGQGVAILHVGFLGIRHTALTSADDRGMAFSHLATRGMGPMGRSVKTTRILGRYPDKANAEIRQKKPSSVLAFSSLPLGNVEHGADSMGLVAMLTPYLLVVVSTMPIAQTQFKCPRPREVAPHGTMTGALAWFPSIKLKVTLSNSNSDSSSRSKLAYCWSNILTVLEVIEVEQSEPGTRSDPVSLQFRPRSKWKAPEAIVAVQWLSRSVLSILTITQQLIVLEDVSMIVTDSSDLIQRHVYHRDLFSHQLDHLVDQLDDEEVAAMHGVVADAFYMSFRAYKGRLFLLGHSDVWFGTLSNWADRLLALMKEGSYIGAIRLATAYYTGNTDKVTVGLPDDDIARHQIVHDKVVEMMLASLRYVFAPGRESPSGHMDGSQLDELAAACITACISIDDRDFLFDEVFTFYQEGKADGVFLEELEDFVNNDQIVTIPPTVLKGLVEHFTARGLAGRLEEMICHLDPMNMDFDQITTLCKANQLYDALLYVWSRGLRDYTTILDDLLDLEEDTGEGATNDKPASKIFPYLSYILTGRVYPTGKDVPDDDAEVAKADLYGFLFSSGTATTTSSAALTNSTFSRLSFPNLRRILDFDSPSFFSVLNEAFEDSFLNRSQEQTTDEVAGFLTEQQRLGFSMNRQRIVRILLGLVVPSEYDPQAIVYLDMFAARNVPKFPDFILLTGHELQQVLIGLCEYSYEDIAEDCELSVEYLLSTYKPPDIELLVPLIHQARFFRVLKGIYKAEEQYAKLLQIYFEDFENQSEIFDCIATYLKPSARLSDRQKDDFRSVLVQHAYEFITIDVQRGASTIDQYAPELHEDFLKTIEDEDYSQYQYLKTVLEPEESEDQHQDRHGFGGSLIEKYVRLLCEFDSLHVTDYIETLQPGDLRLGEVLSSLEEGGAIDAAIILLAREGRVREGINRLDEHLHTLESALTGLLEGLDNSPNIQNTAEAASDLTRSVEKYVRVGIWLCRGQTKLAQRRENPVSQPPNVARKMHETLSADEELWLDLIDTVISVTKNITQNLEQRNKRPLADESNDASSLGTTKIITNLRSVVQETFTALLNATTPPRSTERKKTDASFLRILRAFLTRASLSSPSLSNLRSVLGAIFSAYSYEESLLSLSNRLLDRDLFVHVTEADQLRRRGWRPLGQICEGCGRRVWGPGAGAHIWDAWRQNDEKRDGRHREMNSPHPASGESGHGKGKAVTRHDERSATSSHENQDGTEQESTSAESIVIFACRHIFHRACLVKMGGVSEEMAFGRADPGLSCPLET